MSLNKKSKKTILEYKFLFEEKDQVNNEFLEGNSDLNYRLSFFKSKLDNKLCDQTQKFDDMFFGAQKKEETAIKPLQDDNKDIEISKLKIEHEKWAKTLYRSIISATHPDKTSAIQSKEIINKLTEQYRIAVSAYEKKKYANLIMVGSDLGFDITDEIVDKEMIPAIQDNRKRIKDIKGLIGYSWYHIPEQKKEATLKNYLQQLGFIFTSKQIKEVLKRKAPSRKTGSRPERMNNRKRKLS